MQVKYPCQRKKKGININKKDLRNLISFIDNKIGKYIDPAYPNNKVFRMYIRGKQKACIDVKNILSKLLYDKSQHEPLSKEDVLNLIYIMESKKESCDLESLCTNNGLLNVSIKGQEELYCEVKEVLEDFLCEYDEDSLYQH